MFGSCMLFKSSTCVITIGSLKRGMQNLWPNRHLPRTEVQMKRTIAEMLSIRLLLFVARYWVFLSAFCVCSSHASLMPFPPFVERHDPCYDSDGDPVKCEPQILNPLFQTPVEVSETCGDPNPIVLCRTRIENSRSTRLCELCVQSTGQYSHPARYLTDHHNPENATCWYSDQLTTNDMGERRNVTLSVSFQKMYDITSLILRFCTVRPETMLIYKSKDFGKSWVPFQYFSKRCRSSFGINPRSHNTKQVNTEAICSDTDSDPFPPTDGTVSMYVKDNTAISGNPGLALKLQEWSAATNIKIVLMNVYNADPKSYAVTSQSPTQNGMYQRYRGTVRNKRVFPDAEVSSGLFYGISDITMGARCTCNGHASRCETKHGRPTCVCKHNTEGADCERCKPFHSDRPWRRATEDEANQCIACNCNLHAKRCRFNIELYILSGKKSGGVCYSCRHNTDGRHCHYCKEGYYRNKRRPMTHRKACKPCDCHRLGAAGKTCNQTTGQCTCKDGVVGLTCDRCAPGYQHSSSQIAPCIKIPEGTTEPGECPMRCKTTTPRRFSWKRFCKRDFVIQAQAMGQTDGAEWTWFTLKVMTVFKSPSSLELENALQRIKIRTRDLSCMCPKMRENRKYIMMGNYESTNGKAILIIDSRGLTMPWKETDRRKLNRMKSKASKGMC